MRFEILTLFPESIAPLVREIFTDLTGETQPWAHQVELLAHFGALWQMRATPERGSSSVCCVGWVCSPAWSTTSSRSASAGACGAT